MEEETRECICPFKSDEEIVKKVPEAKAKLDEMYKWKSLFKHRKEKFWGTGFSYPAYIIETKEGKKYSGKFASIGFSCYEVGDSWILGEIIIGLNSTIGGYKEIRVNEIRAIYMKSGFLGRNKILVYP
jgi:hypothetical protein